MAHEHPQWINQKQKCSFLVYPPAHEEYHAVENMTQEKFVANEIELINHWKILSKICTIWNLVYDKN